MFRPPSVEPYPSATTQPNRRREAVDVEWRGFVPERDAQCVVGVVRTFRGRQDVAQRLCRRS